MRIVWKFAMFMFLLENKICGMPGHDHTSLQIPSQITDPHDKLEVCMKTVLFTSNCKAAQFMDLKVIQVTSKNTNDFCCNLNTLSIGKTAKKTNSLLK